MNEETVYVVSKIAGEYDDRWSAILEGRRTKKAAEDYVAELEAKDEARRHIEQQLDQHMKEWHESNIRPRLELLEPIPKWPPGLGEHQITDEMKAHRKAIETRNNDMVKRYRVMHADYYDRFHAHKDAFLTEQGVPCEQHVTFNGYYSPSNYYFSYEIEPVIVR